jgi:hypothetical protein
MSRRPIRATLLPCLAAGLLLAGCGITDPYARSDPAAQESTTTATTRSVPQPVPPASTAASVLERFTTTWLNWTTASLPAQRKQLATQATGALVGQIDGQRGQAISSSQASSSGRFVGAIQQSANTYVVVTYQVTGESDEAQAAYGVYLATVVRSGTDWKVSSWIPTTS